MKPIVIAGNGPSLAQIDYSRLPQDFDVFRCNQFYFENKYFLGKKIKGAFFTHSLLKEQFFTLHHIEKKNEYSVENIYCKIEYDKKISFSSVETTYSYLRKMKKFHQLLEFHQHFFHKNFTSGIHMLIVAIAQGYKEIYLTGIDFYRGGDTDYVFEINPQSNICTRVPNFKKTEFQNTHTEELDVEAIWLALSMPDINLYAISPDTALCEILPLAPIQKQTGFTIENKPKGYICDLIQIPNPLSPFKQKIKDFGITDENIFLKALLDFISIMKALLYASRK